MRAGGEGLAVGVSPTRLVPGDPGALLALAGRLDGLAAGMGASAAHAGGLDTGGWRGKAAGDFGRMLGSIPPQLRQAGGDLADVARGLRSYAGVLGDAQQAAGRAVQLFESGRRRAAAAPSPGPLGAGLLLAPPPSGCGPEETELAEALLAQARREVEDAARRLAASLRARAAHVPVPHTGWPVLRHVTGQFFAGAWETVAATAASMSTDAKLSALGPAADAWQVVKLVETLNEVRHHPAESAKAAVRWDVWRHDPGRAAGELAPDVATLLVTQAPDELIEGWREQEAQDLEAAFGGHTHIRHGGSTELDEQLTRAGAGLTPDGLQLRPNDASRFLSNKDEVQAVRRAVRMYDPRGPNKLTFDMGRPIGEGYLRGGVEYRRTSVVRAVFRGGRPISIYPLLQETP